MRAGRPTLLRDIPGQPPQQSRREYSDRPGRQAGAAWLLAAIVTLVICVAIAAIGYPIGPRFLGTLGVAGIVAPVLLALRWSRERGRQTTPCEARQTTPVRSTQSDRHTRRASSPAATWLGWV